MLCVGYTCTVHLLFYFFHFLLFFFSFLSSLTLDWDSVKQAQLFSQEIEGNRLMVGLPEVMQSRYKFFLCLGKYDKMVITN